MKGKREKNKSRKYSHIMFFYIEITSVIHFLHYFNKIGKLHGDNIRHWFIYKNHVKHVFIVYVLVFFVCV